MSNREAQFNGWFLKVVDLPLTFGEMASIWPSRKMAQSNVKQRKDGLVATSNGQAGNCKRDQHRGRRRFRNSARPK